MNFITYCFGSNDKEEDLYEEKTFIKTETIELTRQYWTNENGKFINLGFILLENNEKNCGEFISLNTKGEQIIKYVRYDNVYYKSSCIKMDRN